MITVVAGVVCYCWMLHDYRRKVHADRIIVLTNMLAVI